ncbi:MAG: transporter substrate-binding domain-containing protein [Bacteroidia bacterium]|nr:transporter substrate-binding domain-containing protein [Bacteroidia bacterium]
MIKRLLILLTIIGTLFSSCSENPTNKDKKDSTAFDLDSIMARGKLVAVTDYNSTNYFLYRGEPMGFHYELLKAFSDHLGIDIEIVTENSIENAFKMLKTGQVDLLAMGLTVSPSRKDEIRFTEPIDSTRQVLVQRKPHKWQTMSFSALESKLIRRRTDLAKKTIYVQKGSSHTELLNQLSNEIGQPITVVEVPFEAEALIQLVDKGEISYAVCDENIASVNATYFPGIDVATELSSPQNLAWGIRKTNSEKLKKELDQWIVNFKTTQTFALLYSKYFKNSRSSTIVKSDYYALSTGKVSRWDDLIKEYSETIKWDWRLLASLICQESRFNPNVISRVGAYGLMQIMPETGKHFGIDITSSPESNIKAGAKYIISLYKIFDPKIADVNERTKFILAAYNAGPGHVLDAMKLAEKNGMDPQKWDDNVAIWILKKSESKYYNDSVVKYGYFKGKESVAFVMEVLERYAFYRNIIPENNEPISYIPHSKYAK